MTTLKCFDLLGDIDPAIEFTKEESNIAVFPLSQQEQQYFILSTDKKFDEFLLSQPNVSELEKKVYVQLVIRNGGYFKCQYGDDNLRAFIRW